jgi:hypothetical protein
MMPCTFIQIVNILTIGFMMKVDDLKQNRLIVDWFRSIKSKPNT